MEHQDFLNLVYGRFNASGAWPLVRDLQVLLRPTNVRLLAADIGSELVVCEEAADGVCFLTLEGLTRCPEAKEDIAVFLAGVREIAQRFIADGPAPVTSEALGVALGTSPETLGRLGLILYRTGGCWSGGGWQTDGRFNVNPNADAVFFEHVTTLEEFMATRRKIAEDAIATSQRRFQSAHNRLLPAFEGRDPLVERTRLGDETSAPTKQKMRVFISWSGERSRQLALVLRDWLPSVIQAAQPYVSSEDIRKGSRWGDNIAKELEQASFGILCIVPGNADAPWLNFEAGALSKIVRDARVVPLLFGVVPSQLIGHPLSQFQSAVFARSEVLKTLQSLNELMGPASLSDARLDKVFERWWPDLVRSVDAVPADTVVEPGASEDTSTAPGRDLSDVEGKILAMWANRSPELALLVSHVVGVLNISEQGAQFYLDELDRKKYLRALHTMNKPSHYRITHQGRAFLVNNGLT